MSSTQQDVPQGDPHFRFLFVKEYRRPRRPETRRLSALQTLSVYCQPLACNGQILLVGRRFGPAPELRTPAAFSFFSLLRNVLPLKPAHVTTRRFCSGVLRNTPRTSQFEHHLEWICGPKT